MPPGRQVPRPRRRPPPALAGIAGYQQAPAVEQVVRKLVRAPLADPLDRAHCTDRPRIHARALPARIAERAERVHEPACRGRQQGGYRVRILLVVALFDGTLVPAHRRELRGVRRLGKHDPVTLEAQDVPDVAAVLER